MYIRKVEDDEIKDEEHLAFLRGYEYAIDTLKNSSWYEPHASVGGVYEVTEIALVTKAIREIVDDTVTEAAVYLEHCEDEIKLSFAEEEYVREEEAKEKPINGQMDIGDVGVVPEV